jgi:thiamine-phosphate pyrophosphorylase
LLPDDEIAGLKLTLPKIYPITDRQLSGLSHADQTRRFIEGGAKLIQLREKSNDMRRFLDDAMEAVRTARENVVTILINDRIDIALMTSADGVHLGQYDLPPKQARKLLGSNAIIGFSTHNIKQIQEAMMQPIDYIAFGPIFSTSTKTNPDPVVGMNLLEEASRLVGDWPLVAIGGINSKNMASVIAAGAHSAAMIGEFYRRNNSVTSQFKSITELLENNIVS